MSMSTRLILLLTLMVIAVMAVASILILREHERALKTAMRNELRAHAFTLEIALEEEYAAGRMTDLQRLINRLLENTKVYGVIFFDEHGRVAMLSDPLIAKEIQHPPELDQVISTGKEIEFERDIGGQEVFSIIIPIHGGGRLRGAFEIAQPLSFVKANIARVRRNHIIMASLLLIIIFFVVLVVTRRNVAHPIKELLGGAVALGRGDLDYRVIVPKRSSDLAQLAQEFNRMADSFSEQRRTTTHEAEERLALERQLRHSERLASVGRLAAGIAHEMGAPLNVIDARAEQLLAHPDTALKTRQRNLTIIRVQVERITRIVRQLLNLASPYKLHRECIDLAHLIDETLEQIEANATDAGVGIEVTAEAQVLVEADKDLLRQVILNICLNGIQAMPTGGRLRIECVRNGGEKDGRHFAAMRITDTGCGIMPEQLAHIFEPFYTTKDVGHGTGLGLTVSCRIIEEHGGRIEVDNNPDGGTIFTVYLPRSEKLPTDLAQQSENVRHDEGTVTGR